MTEVKYMNFQQVVIDFGQKPVDAAINELREELHLNFKRKRLKKTI